MHEIAMLMTNVCHCPTNVIQAPTSGGACTTAPSVVVGSNTFSNTATGTTLTFAASTGCPGFQAFNVNYFRFTPSTTAEYTISTCKTSNFDTKMGLLTACTTGVVGCNDDGPGCTTSGFGSTVVATLTSGTTYYIALGGYSATEPTGGGTLVISRSTVSPTTSPTTPTAVITTQSPTTPTPVITTQTPTKSPTLLPLPVSSFRERTEIIVLSMTNLEVIEWW